MNANEAKKLVKKVISVDTKEKMNLTPMLWGAPGIGKSAILRQICDETNFKLEEIRLSTLSPVDVRGVPYVDPSNQENFKFIPPKFLPTKNDDYVHVIDDKIREAFNNAKDEEDVIIDKTDKLPKHFLKHFSKEEILSRDDVMTNHEDYYNLIKEGDKVIMKKKPVLLFFDEINTAVPANQVVAYEIALDRRMGGHPLPINTHVVLAGNRAEDKGATYEMPMPLANRLIHVYLDPDVNAFIAYGIKHNLNPYIFGYLKFNEAAIHAANSKDNKRHNYAFPTPRTWEMVSLFLNDAKENNEDMEKIRPVIKGLIGDGEATQFLAFLKIEEKLPNLNNILYNGETFKTNEKDIIYFYIVSLSMKLLKMKEILNGNINDKNTRSIITNYINALLVFPKEFQALALSLVKDNEKVMIQLSENSKLLDSLALVFKINN